MSEQWKTLMEPEDSGFVSCLTLGRVSLSRKTGDMTIGFQSSRILKAREYDTLCARMRREFTGSRVNVLVMYHGMKETIVGDLSVAAPEIRSAVRAESPGSVPFIDWNGANWKLENGTLTLPVLGAGGLNFLRAKQLDQMIGKLMERLFDIPCTVNFTRAENDEQRVREILEARERESAALAADAAKMLANPENAKRAVPSDAVYGHPIHDSILPMDQIAEDSGRFAVRGEVSGLEIKDTKTGKTKIVTFLMSDYLGSVNCKLFLGGKRSADDPKSIQEQADALAAALKDGKWVTAKGSYRYDDYKREMILMVSDIQEAEKPVRMDTAPEKRVELHMHTTFSEMDALATATDLIKTAAKWGHKAIAVTDHGVVQAFPEAFGAAKKAGIKLIPGCEGYLIEDDADIVWNAKDETIDGSTYVVFDVETTGLNTHTDRIIEIGAVRFENGEEVAEFSELIDPEIQLPDKITEITHITSAMLQGMRTIRQALPDFVRFCEGAVLVAHNASFDTAFFRRAYKLLGLDFDYVVLDTLPFARNQYTGFKNHKLGTLCKNFGISLKNAHRAVHDARATALVLMHMLKDIREQKGLSLLREINTAFSTDRSKRAYHIILLAMNQTGMTNLYRLVSEAHLHYFYRTPRIPRSLITKYREGLIVGSACEAGELFQAVLSGESPKKIEQIARFYDYLEVQPIGNNEFMVRNGTVKDDEALRDLNRRIVELGERLNIPVCATGDVHFLNPTDAIYRTILLASQGFEDADYQPPLYLKTTNEMLDEFSYLGREKAKEIVITNPNRFADMLGDVKVFLPHPEGKETFQPFWPEAEGDLRRIVNDRAHEIYGDELPDVVQKRLDKELGAIIGYGFSTLYMIAVKLVAKSLSDGYIVGSRGSVGSSLVANYSGITEVDSLPPHYVCPKCKHSEFDVPPEYTTGLDLPPKDCPICGARMNKDGFNIPFEVFLGFKGDKVPDIDLNFSGVYQPVAHNYIKELFGAEYCYRAGTIGTVADKTAYGYVLKYAEEKGLSLTNAEKERLAKGMTGVKRTTGQHPAGMVVLPKEYSIYQFTPIQHPANDMTTDTITTHFDFTSMHDVLVKLDVLGHDDPTMLRKLQDITGIAPQQVPLNEPEVFQKIISLFAGTEALGITAEELGISQSGTLGIPEFGTPFVRGMLRDTKPSTMEELIRISGLSHGTDVWLGNAQDLVNQGVPLRECICTRDDIMNQLISYGVEPAVAFKTMESVRKGRGLQDFMQKAIEEVDAPPWFIDSCKKIKYMFPKAHAVAYVTMALRIAYFKVFYPSAYYSCYLFRNADCFDATRMTTRNVDQLRGMIEAIKQLDKKERESKNGENTMLEILLEMNLRGIHMKSIDLYKSDAVEFLIDEDDEIVPPISSVPGIGASVAEQYCEIRKNGAFISVDDMVRRKVPKSIIEMFRQVGALAGMPETSQVSLFEF